MLAVHAQLRILPCYPADYRLRAWHLGRASTPATVMSTQKLYRRVDSRLSTEFLSSVVGFSFMWRVPSEPPCSPPSCASMCPRTRRTRVSEYKFLGQRTASCIHRRKVLLP